MRPLSVEEELDRVISHLLRLAYERQLSSTQMFTALSRCPEIKWLAMCAVQAPLPPEWRAFPEVEEMAPGFRPSTYVNRVTGETSEVLPFLASLAGLARCALRARDRPECRVACAEAVRQALREAHWQTSQAEERWSGPFEDRVSGHSYFQCQASGESSWVDPVAHFRYVASVARRLLDAEAFGQGGREVLDLPACELLEAAAPTEQSRTASAGPYRRRREATARAAPGGPDTDAEVMDVAPGELSPEACARPEPRRRCAAPAPDPRPEVLEARIEEAEVTVVPRLGPMPPRSWGCLCGPADFGGEPGGSCGAKAGGVRGGVFDLFTDDAGGPSCSTASTSGTPDAAVETFAISTPPSSPEEEHRDVQAGGPGGLSRLAPLPFHEAIFGEEPRKAGHACGLSPVTTSLACGASIGGG